MLVAGVVLPEDLDAVRRILRGLVLPGQRATAHEGAAGCRDTLRYEHRRASAELALAIPDAIAWYWAKGGDWRRRIEPVVADVREV